VQEQTKFDWVSLADDDRSPMERAMEIQEALKPLGYVVHGYTDENCGNTVVIYLRRGGGRVFPQSGQEKRG
jgi:hypothetical protein